MLNTESERVYMADFRQVLFHQRDFAAASDLQNRRHFYVLEF